MIYSKSISTWSVMSLSLTLVLAGSQVHAQRINDNGVIQGPTLNSNNYASPDFFVPGRSENFRFEEESDEFATIKAIAEKAGLDGKWIVLDVEKDGEFSKAQIGQEYGDVISIEPGKDPGMPLALG